MHEAYLRLVGAGDGLHWNNRRHFFMAAAEAMRRILVDNARRKLSVKHGGDWRRCDVDAVDAEVPAEPEPEMDLAALDAALCRLADVDPQKAKLVELRYFAGMTGDQASAVLGISSSSADRQWVYARAWLRARARLWRGALTHNSRNSSKFPGAGGAISRIEMWRQRGPACEVAHE